jgi:hypothetical protein
MKQKFSELKTELAADGFLPIVNTFEQRVIELPRHRKCHGFFTYKGFADAIDEKAFAVCETCDYAEEFFVNAVEPQSKTFRARR